jgi:hypothetical protein
MPISWTEIRQNAIRFAADWAGEKSESAEKQAWFKFARFWVATIDRQRDLPVFVPESGW